MDSGKEKRREEPAKMREVKITRDRAYLQN